MFGLYRSLLLLHYLYLETLKNLHMAIINIIICLCQNELKFELKMHDNDQSLQPFF